MTSCSSDASPAYTRTHTATQQHTHTHLLAGSPLQPPPPAASVSADDCVEGEGTCGESNAEMLRRIDELFEEEREQQVPTARRASPRHTVHCDRCHAASLHVRRSAPLTLAEPNFDRECDAGRGRRAQRDINLLSSDAVHKDRRPPSVRQGGERVPCAAPLGARLGLPTRHALRWRVFGAARCMRAGWPGGGRALIGSTSYDLRSAAPESGARGPGWQWPMRSGHTPGTRARFN